MRNCCFYYISLNKIVRVLFMEACRRSGGIAPPALNLGDKWRLVVNITPRVVLPRKQRHDKYFRNRNAKPGKSEFTYISSLYDAV